MNIIRIAKDAVKCMLTKTDLIERNLTVNDFAECTAKGQEMIMEILGEVSEELGEEGAPSYSVTMRTLSHDHLEILVKKEGEQHIPPSIHEILSAMERLGIGQFNPINPALSLMRQNEDEEGEEYEEAAEELTDKEGKIIAFHFEKLEDISAIAPSINKIYNGRSSLYKGLYDDGGYYLYMHQCGMEDDAFEQLGARISEFAYEMDYNVPSEIFLKENGNLLIEDKALKKLDLESQSDC